MNNFKNFVIIVLSILVVFQSILLLRLVSEGKDRRHHGRQKKAVVSTVAATAEMKTPRKEVQPLPVNQEEPAKPKAITPKILGKIALVLDDWGYNLKNKDFITGNNFHVTLSVLPFLPYSRTVSELAHEHHKQVIIHMPMEPHQKERYGLEKNTLMVGMDRVSIERAVNEAFDSVSYPSGMSNHMGSRATEDARLMKILFGILKERDVLFLDSLVTSKSVGERIAGRMKLRFAARDVFIDNESDPSYIRAQLIKLAHSAGPGRVVVGIGHDRETTIDVLEEVIPFLQSEGYQFVDLSEAI